ncbi:hypothetical protein M5F00_15255 [Acinetobacter sp. ANC 4945]|uniref:Uncharacterized protein n=1 Tax=Acinetobacter amyesii TaxID=2942470 RepID=A0A1T1GRJ4_9GAMM|nr:hypothetical protein [Acinetobacter amyesii]MCL6249214.1 hypothetical protein [Acinetobacter amyesii]OOV80232.1 hypothetical protein B1202_14060 [Acinetobacter amyesii]
MNIKILDSQHFDSKMNMHLQQYLIEHHLPKIGFYHVVAKKGDTIIALGMLYSNHVHPHRDYILFHEVQNDLEANLFIKLINNLEKKSKTRRLQLILNSRNNSLRELFESHRFYIARTTYLIELTEITEIYTDIKRIKTKKLNQMSKEEWQELKKLFHKNYRRFHEGVNVLAQEFSPDLLFEYLKNINIMESTILLNQHSQLCAYFLIGGSDENSIEVAYLGGMDEDHMDDYLFFFQNELSTLLKKFKTVYFEADDSDDYFSALMQKLNCDLSDSYYTLIKDLEE